MILTVNENYRITSDRYQWMVQKKGKKGRWHSLGYLPSLEGAVNFLAEYEIRMSDADNVVDAIKEAKRIGSMLAKALDPEYEVQQVGSS